VQASNTKVRLYGNIAGLTLGRVYNVYPHANMVDVMLFDGTVLNRVQVMANSSSRTGLLSLPLPSYEKSMLDRDMPLDSAKQNESDVVAIVGFLKDNMMYPIVLGFLFPEENEILCGKTDQIGNKDGSMLLWKHESNVYVRVAKGGTEDKPVDIEISHPSGLLIKIGDYDVALGDDGQKTPIVNWDKDIRPFKCKNPLNDELGPVPHVYVYHPSGTYLVVDDAGNVQVHVVGDVGHIIHGDLNETIDGNVVRTITGNKTETIHGVETDQVDGNWDRTSNAEIKDTAPVIHHQS
jgi:hypothetical protein